MQPKTAVSQKVVDLIQSKGGRFVQKEERENGKSRVNKPRGLYWPKNGLSAQIGIELTGKPVECT